MADGREVVAVHLGVERRDEPAEVLQEAFGHVGVRDVAPGERGQERFDRIAAPRAERLLHAVRPVLRPHLVAVHERVLEGLHARLPRVVHDARHHAAQGGVHARAGELVAFKAVRLGIDGVVAAPAGDHHEAQNRPASRRGRRPGERPVGGHLVRNDLDARAVNGTLRAARLDVRRHVGDVREGVAEEGVVRLARGVRHALAGGEVHAPDGGPARVRAAHPAEDDAQMARRDGREGEDRRILLLGRVRHVVRAPSRPVVGDAERARDLVVEMVLRELRTDPHAHRPDLHRCAERILQPLLGLRALRADDPRAALRDGGRLERGVEMDIRRDGRVGAHVVGVARHGGERDDRDVAGEPDGTRTRGQAHAHGRAARHDRLRPAYHLHRVLGLDPRPAGRTPSRAVVERERQPQPVGLAPRPVHHLVPFGRKALHGPLVVPELRDVEDRRAAEARPLHRLQVLRDARTRDVVVHPVPPRARPRLGGRVREPLRQRIRATRHPGNAKGKQAHQRQKRRQFFLHVSKYSISPLGWVGCSVALSRLFSAFLAAFRDSCPDFPDFGRI